MRKERKKEKKGETGKKNKDYALHGTDKRTDTNALQRSYATRIVMQPLTAV